MKKKVILQLAIPLVVSTLLIACDRVTSFTEQNVVLASGVNVKTDKFVVVNPFIGKQIESCAKTIIIEKNNPTAQGSYQSESSSTGTQTNQGCDNQIFEPSQPLLNALRTANPIEGFILKDGKQVKARFFVSVQALYEGSYCTTYYINGNAYTNCVTQDDIDNAN